MSKNKSRVSRLSDNISTIGGVLASLNLHDDSNEKISNDKRSERSPKKYFESTVDRCRTGSEIQTFQSPDHKSNYSQDESRPIMFHIGGKENTHAIMSPLASPILQTFDSPPIKKKENICSGNRNPDFDSSLSHASYSSSSSCQASQHDDDEESESTDDQEEEDDNDLSKDDSQDIGEEDDDYEDNDDEEYDDNETESEDSNSFDSEGNPYVIEEEYVPYGRQLSITNEDEENSEYEDSYAIDSHDQESDRIEQSHGGSDTETEAGSVHNSSASENVVDFYVEETTVEKSSRKNFLANETQSECDISGSEENIYSSDSDHACEENLETKEFKAYDHSAASSSCSTSHLHGDRSLLKRGKWTMGSQIGQGSFGVVHVGMNSLTGKLMAVKTMNISSGNRQLYEDIHREIEFMKSFEHTNIVKYLGCEIDREKQVLHIFQEWVPGGSVASLLRKFGPFPLSVIRSYLYQILNGLSYLHLKNILHRDIKGGNVLVNDDGVVKLADFGASKCIECSEEDRMENMTMCGTPYFMAPEVFKESYGTKADVWACACVAYQMCTTNPPWKGLGIKSPLRLFSYIMENEGPPPLTVPMPTEESEFKDQILEPTMSSTLADLMERCFIRDSEVRPSVTSLLEHEFFQETDSLDGSILADESILESVVALSPISPFKIRDIRMSEQKKKKDVAAWPSWAK